MNPNLQSRDVYGEQGGSSRPFLKIAIASAICILGLLPQIASAEYNSRKDITDAHLEKISDSYGQMIDIAALLHDYDANMIKAVIVVESEGNSVAVSHKGAKGLMQLMPQTAKAMGAKDPKDPFQNILAGTKYLKQLENRYGFNDAKDALVAYNMGPSRAKRWLSQYDSTEYSYVKKVMYVYDILIQNEVENKRITAALGKKIDDVTSYNDHAHPILTKPKSISLATVPLTLPNSRRDEVTTDN